MAINTVTTINLNEIARWIYESCFYESFWGTVSWSSKMKGIAGNCKSNGEITINKNYYLKYGLEETILILKHELSHLYCFKKIGTHDDNSDLFLETLQKLGGIIKAKRIPETFYIYECPICKKRWFFEELLNEKELLCKTCNQIIVFKEKRKLY